MKEATLYTLNARKVIVGSESSIRTYITRSGCHIGSNMVSLDEDNVMVDFKPQEITLPLYRITRVLKPDDPFINPLSYDDLRIKEFYFAIEPALADILEQPYINENSRLENELYDLDVRYKKSSEECEFWKSECERIKTQAHEEIEKLNSQIEALKNQSLRQKLVSIVRKLVSK